MTRPVTMPARALMEQAQRTQVSPGPQLPLRGPCLRSRCARRSTGGDPPRHWMAQERLTIHTHGALCSQETRALIKHERAFRQGRPPAS